MKIEIAVSFRNSFERRPPEAEQAGAEDFAYAELFCGLVGYDSGQMKWFPMFPYFFR